MTRLATLTLPPALAALVASVAFAFPPALPAQEGGATSAGGHHHAPRAEESGGLPDGLPDTAAAGVPVRDSLVVEGGRIDVSIAPFEEGAETLRAGERLSIRLELTDSGTREPLVGRMPSAWIDFREEDGTTGPTACHDRIGRYMRQRLRTRPVIDLNSYFVLALNRGNNISVIDPFLGFGSSKLYTTVLLPGAGADWAVDDAGRWLYVTIPKRNVVAVVGIGTWDVEASITVETAPRRIRFQPDGARLWVTTSAGVAAIDPATRQVSAVLSTGAGPHDIEFARDGDLLFVTNPPDGTLSVIETAGERVLGTLPVGGNPVDLAYSKVSGAMYVVDGEAGTVTAVAAGDTLRPVGRLTGAPGLTELTFDPSGRWGFLLNPVTDEVHLLDARTNEIQHRYEVAGEPFEVSFSESFAYVRARRTADVVMIPLPGLTPDPSALEPFSAGQIPPAEFGPPGIATGISSAPHMRDAVYVPNPGEKVIYYYHYMEGMPTPSGTLNNYGFAPLATLTVGRKLDEIEPGTYTSVVRAPPAGEYDLVFMLHEPHVVHCFPFGVASNPRMAAAEPPDIRIQAEALPTLHPGTPADVRFRLMESGSPAAITPGPVRVRVISPTGWWTDATARPNDKGVYGTRVTVPEPGAYYLTVAVSELGRGFRDQYPLVLHAAPAPPD